MRRTLSIEQRRVRASIRLLAKVWGNKRLKVRLHKSLGKLEARLSKANAPYVKADEERAAHRANMRV